MLAVCLSIPHWIYSVTEKSKDRLSQLEPGESFHLCDFSVSYPLLEARLEKQNQKNVLRNSLIYYIALMQKLGSAHHLTNRLMK